MVEASRTLDTPLERHVRDLLCTVIYDIQVRIVPDHLLASGSGVKSRPVSVARLGWCPSSNLGGPGGTSLHSLIQDFRWAPTPSPASGCTTMYSVLYHWKGSADYLTEGRRLRADTHKEAHPDCPPATRLRLTWTRLPDDPVSMLDAVGVSGVEGAVGKREE